MPALLGDAVPSIRGMRTTAGMTDMMFGHYSFRHLFVVLLCIVSLMLWVFDTDVGWLVWGQILILCL